MTNYVSNILEVFKQCTKEELEHGLTWYQQAKDRCQEIADKNEMPLHISVGAVSALSPTNNWEQNLKDGDLFCTTFADGGYREDVKASTYKKMWDKAWSILEENGDYETTANILNGPKITDFYRCIMGENVCVIDGHAWCIAFADRRVMQEVPFIGKKLRVELQEAYTIAGEQHGMTAYQMQAATWVAWRRIHGVGR